MTEKRMTSSTTTAAAIRRRRNNLRSNLLLNIMICVATMLIFSSIPPPPPLLPRASALSSSFHGSRLVNNHASSSPASATRRPAISDQLVMRKQKASDKRTARMQRGLIDTNADASSSSFAPPSLEASSTTSSISISTATQILASSPSMTKNQWNHKKIEARAAGEGNDASGGRGRARKRLKLYNSLASYHSTFLELISEEYRMEEAEVVARLEASIADPFLLERSGHALFDVHPQRRGNLFNDEVYRLEKSFDATTTFFASNAAERGGGGIVSPLPPNHNFARNDVIVMTLQPRGTGDFLGPSSLPTAKDAIVVEARVLNVGPTYLDVAIPSGKYSTAFGPASNNFGEEGRGDPDLRVRVDRFFSDVPFKRMMAALGQLTSVPEQQQPGGSSAASVSTTSGGSRYDKRVGGFQMDALLKEAILSTFAIKDDVMLDGMSNPSLGDLPKKLAKPPLPTSTQLADQVMAYIRANPNKLFPDYNEPQLTAIRSALTRRLTLIQGPPGTGKTTTAGSIAFGFVHQCRSLSPHCKVLATAFSNVGSDNLADQFLKLGLKVVRVGKASGVSEALWEHTLDAAIERDPGAQKALEEAARATAKVNTKGGARMKKDEGGNGKRTNKGSLAAERAKRDAATEAVKASIQACNIAATRALREADVIVATSVGAADAQLLAACGIYPDDEDETTKSNSRRRSAVDLRPRTQFGTLREFAPDNLPPLTTPFVIVDEACQSVEPASLIPIVSTNSCRSLVMLGDPCQLPPTVRSDASSTGESPLSVSLMSRLASTLPPPVTVTAQRDNTPLDTKYLQCKPTRQAVSKVAAAAGMASDDNGNGLSYRKRFAGSLLLSVQYRMHPSIAAFSSAIFYDGLLSSPLTLSSSRRFPRRLLDSYPMSSDSEVSVRFVKVGGRNNESREAVTSGGEDLTLAVADLINNNSYRNDAEARQVVRMLAGLLQGGDDNVAPFKGSIGVVTPYSAQVALIKSMMARDEQFRRLAQSFPYEIEVKSVDAYQGRERDLIIFSAVRSNRRGNVGFLADWRRMNVALTRARDGLVVIGDSETLEEGDRHWAAFVRWCQGVGCFLDSDLTSL